MAAGNREPLSAHDPPGRPGGARPPLGSRGSERHPREAERDEGPHRRPRARARPTLIREARLQRGRTARGRRHPRSAPTLRPSRPTRALHRRSRGSVVACPRAAAITPSARTAPAGTAATVATARATPAVRPPGSSPARATHRATSEGSTASDTDQRRDQEAGDDRQRYRRTGLPRPAGRVPIGPGVTPREPHRRPQPPARDRPRVRRRRRPRPRRRPARCRRPVRRGRERSGDSTTRTTTARCR